MGAAANVWARGAIALALVLGGGAACSDGGGGPAAGGGAAGAGGGGSGGGQFATGGAGGRTGTADGGARDLASMPDLGGGQDADGRGGSGGRGGDATGIGDKKVLVMRVDFPDKPGAPATDAETQTAMSSVDAFFRAQSHGKASLTPTVTPVLRMPMGQSAYVALGNYPARLQLLADATRAAGALGYDPAAFQRRFVWSSGKAWDGQAGYGDGANDAVWTSITGRSMTHHLSHEFGHSYGLPHAELWDASTIIGPGAAIAYGDLHDTMGSGSGQTKITPDFNPAYKDRLGWYAPGEVVTVTRSGTFMVLALEEAPDGKTSALRIPATGGNDYWVYFRQKFEPSYVQKFPRLRDGALVSRVASTNRGSAFLLDMTPGSMGGTGDWDDSIDAVLLPGNVLLDSAAGIEIRVLGKGGTSPETLGVEVTVGPGAAN